MVAAKVQVLRGQGCRGPMATDDLRSGGGGGREDGWWLLVYIEPMYRGPSRGPCIGTIYPILLGFGGIHLIILSYRNHFA